MKYRSYRYLFVNIFILPFLLVLGGVTPLSIASFWLLSFVITLFYLKNIFKECGLLYLLSPCLLTYFYCIINYVTGSLYYTSDVLSSSLMYERFFGINNINLIIIVVYLNLCNTIIVLISSKFPFLHSDSSKEELSNQKSWIIILVLFFLYFLFHIIKVDLSFMGGKSLSSDEGGSGTGLNYPLIVGLIVLFVHKLNMLDINKFIRFAIYLFIVITMAMDSVGSKRELFFSLLCIILVELIWHDFRARFSIRNIVIVFIVGSISFLYVLSASIVRGYGGFDVEDITEAVTYVPEYAQSEIFNEVVGNNLETPYHYASSVIACDYVLSGKLPLLFGSSFLKVLFIPIPRSVFNYKPQNMVDAFTRAYDPDFRDIGGSYPVSIYSEFLANFHFFGIAILFFFFFFIQKLYVKIMSKGNRDNDKYLYYIPFFALFLQFVRGSGLDLLLIYCILAAISIFACKITLRIFDRSSLYR